MCQFDLGHMIYDRLSDVTYVVVSICVGSIIFSPLHVSIGLQNYYEMPLFLL